MNMKKFLLIVGGLSIGLFITARVINKRRSKGGFSPKGGVREGFPLKKGSRGAKVEALQRFLNKEDSSANLKVNGKFDDATLAAWKLQQYPFENFVKFWPNAVEGEVHEDYYDTYIKEHE